MLGRRGTLPFLVGPPLLWLAALFVAPLFLIVLFSLRPESGMVAPGRPWDPSLVQYIQVLKTPSFLRLLGTSTLIALGVAAMATLLAYPLAYFLAFRARARATLYLTLLLVPFAASYLLRIMSWKLMLGPAGVINSLLSSAGLISEPLDLIFTRPAVVVTLVYVWIPFAALPILAAMQRIQPSQLEAAADLGAGPWARLWRVTVPLSLPGALAAFFMVFIPTVGEYVTPTLIGGTGGIMYGNLISDFFGRGGNWPFGAALAMLMLLLTVVLVVAAARAVNLRRLIS
ncbi:MAG TPA: ABC transporter permease [Candidatus Limnocylindria bacterium]|nr:ABC transporter permease [Candidatus Limnocylindria bacterium]